MSLSAIQKKFLDKVEQKCNGGNTVQRQLRKYFTEVDLDNDGFVNVREWASVVERTGGAISSDEACALFEFWDTAGYAREPNGLVSTAEIIASLMTSEVSSEAVFDQRGAPPSRGNEGNTRNMGNRPSAPGGIFGGGVYESDAHFAQKAQVASLAPPAPFEQARPVERPRGNQSSVEGGIFGEGPAADESPRKGKVQNNRSSLSGGIFGQDENAAPARPAMQKRNANASSIPGGIFG